jgi:hypothetical protein
MMMIIIIMVSCYKQSTDSCHLTTNSCPLYLQFPSVVVTGLKHIHTVHSSMRLGESIYNAELLWRGWHIICVGGRGERSEPLSCTLNSLTFSTRIPRSRHSVNTFISVKMNAKNWTYSKFTPKRLIYRDIILLILLLHLY